MWAVSCCRVGRVAGPAADIAWRDSTATSHQGDNLFFNGVRDELQPMLITDLKTSLWGWGHFQVKLKYQVSRNWNCAKFYDRMTLLSCRWPT